MAYILWTFVRYLSIFPRVLDILQAGEVRAYSLNEVAQRGVGVRPILCEQLGHYLLRSESNRAAKIISVLSVGY